jgi:hypothetical protein
LSTKRREEACAERKYSYKASLKRGNIMALRKTLVGNYIAGVPTHQPFIEGEDTLVAPNGNPIVTGIVPISGGGTGEITAQSAINALVGAPISGHVLRGDGTNVTMSSIQVDDVPTLNQDTSGTAANVTGVVAVAHGGTGETGPGAARTSLGLDFYSIGGGYIGTPKANEIIFLCLVDHNIAIPVNFANSQFKCITAPTSVDTVFTVYKNGTSIGTITFAYTSGTVTPSTVDAVNPTALSAGDWIKISAPADLHSIEHIMWTIKGTY